MALVTITEAKNQLRIDDDVPVENLQLSLTAAEGYVIGAIGADLSSDDYSDVKYNSVKAVAKQAILMLAAQWHNNPTGEQKKSEPTFGIKALITQAGAGVL